MIGGAPVDLGTHVPVHTKVVVGREASDLLLRDARVSRFHASITKRGATYWLSDLGSTNGTTVNGERIAERHLRDGDLLEFGAITIRFEAS